MIKSSALKLVCAMYLMFVSEEDAVMRLQYSDHSVAKLGCLGEKRGSIPLITTCELGYLTFTEDARFITWSVTGRALVWHRSLDPICSTIIFASTLVLAKNETAPLTVLFTSGWTWT